jgi:predicted dehydrogenase
MNNNCWLVGAGFMANEYIKAMKALDIKFTVVGRSDERIAKLRAEFDVHGISGGVQDYINSAPAIPEYSIVAVSVEQLLDVTLSLIEAGVKCILVEKPAGLSQSDIDLIADLASQSNAQVSVAYNRRFYKSVSFLKERITEDGGITSINFEFTEWVHTIDTDKFPEEVLNKFLIANSTHVIDTVFHLAGKPRILNADVSGKAVEWHPSGSIFSGSGVTVNDIPFTYSSNWGAPGRWAIEVCTRKRRYYLKPMERLSVQEIGSVQINDFIGDYSVDENFKAGVYEMTKAFFTHNNEYTCDIMEHQLNFPYYEEIAGYK